ncbi:MAG: extracellular solute-binding protein [bacterium]
MKRFMVVFLMVGMVLVSGAFTARAAEEINVIYMAQAAYQPPEIRDMADFFEELTGIKVNLEFVKYDEQHEKIVASAVAPVPTYDVFSLDLIWTAEFASRGFAVPLDDYMTPEIKADIAPAILDAFVFNGKTWAMPFLANFQLFFYNIDMIKKAGFTGAPKTLEEMVEQMEAIKAKGIVKYPWTDSWNQKEGLTCEYVWLTGAFGGDTFDEKGRPIFNTGPGLKALEFMVMLLEKGLASPKSLTNDEPAAKDDFISGNAAFTSNWTFQYGLMNDPAVSKVVGAGKMGLLPVSKDVLGKYPNDTASVSGFQGAAILANSKNKEAAWKYIRYITSPIVQRAYLTEMPVWTSVQTSAYAKTMDPVIDIKAKEIASVHHRPKVPPYPEVSSILQRYIHLTLEGKLKPKAALDKARAEIEAVMGS